MPHRYGIQAARRRASAGYTPGVLPTTSGTLHTWYNARKETAANGATLTTLTDWSGNGHTGTAGGTGTITMASTGVNGKAAFKFPASGTGYFDTAAFTSINSTVVLHIFGIVKFVATGTSQAILGAPTGTPIRVGSSGSAYSAVRGGTAMSGGTVDTNAHRLHLYSPASGAATATLDLDGTTIAGPAGIASSAQTQWRFGSNSSAQQYTGYVGEWVIFTGDLAPSDVSNMDAYLVGDGGF